MNKKNKDGFTLIELLVCISIISTLVFGVAGLYVLIHFLCKFW